MKDQSDVLNRLKKLEDAVFGTSSILAPVKSSVGTDFSGPKGGVLLLLSEKFFDKKKTAVEITDVLKDRGYNYLKTVIQTALRRMSTSKGPLVAFAEGGVKYYAVRR